MKDLRFFLGIVSSFLGSLLSDMTASFIPTIVGIVLMAFFFNFKIVILNANQKDAVGPPPNRRRA